MKVDPKISLQNRTVLKMIMITKVESIVVFILLSFTIKISLKESLRYVIFTRFGSIRDTSEG